ncbi:MAG: DNA mismatch repair endonuclease MutL [Gemmatimonadetes bacterium]|nr:DNA mismatch repair endonuclease MutL [Gemmatimonadota bacterium]
MARTIEVLPDLVANQIAAGEVVERPASVVKELVENALDARATRVDIDIEHGGKRRIRVTDDGVGMGREDALLSLDRHATSKIRAAVDLQSVETFGFRGEALPSIAAVSRMTLETKGDSDQLGTRVRVKGGTITGVEDVSRRRGTTVEVSDLFFNAPARAKFLKAVGAEARAVSDAVSLLALANASVGFGLTSGGRILLELPPATDLTARVAALWGREAATTLIALSTESEGLQVRGLIQRPDAAKSGFRRAHLFVNGRPFRSRTLLAALDRGYRTTISERVRPWAFLYLRMPAGTVDMNVHPAKAEVRFRDDAAVESFVEEAVRAGLTSEASAATLDTQLAPPQLLVREPSPPRPDKKSEVEGQTTLFLSASATMPSGAVPLSGAAPSSGVAPFSGTAASPGSSAAGAVTYGVTGRGAATDEVSADPVPVLEERPRLWQVLNTYVLAETREGLIIIDQHSAHERILFERLNRAFEESGQTGQRLLFPLTIRLAKAEYEQVEALTGILNRVGFEVEGFGGNTIIVHAVPDPHPYFDPERCLREMIDELVAGSDLTRSAKNQHEKIAMTFACKGAIKAGQRLSETEMQELFDQLFATELPYHDVHGRPTIVRLSKSELERKFGR